MADERVYCWPIQWGMFWWWVLFRSCYFLSLFFFLVFLLSLLSLPCFGHWSLMQQFHHMGHTVGTACSVCLSPLFFN